VVDYSAKQTKAAFETAKEQFGYAGTPVGTLAESWEKGVEVLAQAQKDLLDTLREPIQILH